MYASFIPAVDLHPNMKFNSFGIECTITYVDINKFNDVIVRFMSKIGDVFECCSMTVAKNRQFEIIA